MKVCHLIDHMGLGGAQRMVADLVELHDAAISASVLSLRSTILPQFSERLGSAGVAFETLSLTRHSLSGPSRLRRALAAGRFDLVHAHLDYSNSIGVLAALSLPRPRPAVVSQIHNSPRRHNSTLFRATASLVAPYLDAHLVATESLRRETAQALHHRARRIETIELGIDLSRFSTVHGHNPASGSVRQGARRVVGFIGRLADQKNIGTLLRCAPVLLAAEPSTRVLIVGDGPERTALAREAARLGIAPAVTFAGYLDDVRSAYAAFDVLVLPSRHEGFGLVLAEAMAMEVPIVASRCTGVVDVVEDGKTAILVPPGDTNALASAILRVLDDAALRRRLAAAGRQQAVSRYGRQRMSRRVDALYREILGARDSG